MDRFPPPWSQSEVENLQQSLRLASRSLLMLDYDGTLAPFHEDRFQARVYPGVAERLLALSGLPRVHLVLVSGRSARELKALLPADLQVDIWGSHGWEHLFANGGYQLFDLPAGQQAIMQEATKAMTSHGYGEALERKAASLAVHWRSCEPCLQDQIQGKITEIFRGFGEQKQLQLLPFDGGLELRSYDRTKGTAVSEIVGQEKPDIPVAYLGDDLTDEDAFAAVGDRGYSILVRSEPRNSCARFWLQPPEGLLQFLDQWIAAFQSQASLTGAMSEANH